jgi:hypothetical protein
LMESMRKESLSSDDAISMRRGLFGFGWIFVIGMFISFMTDPIVE